jgi:hypothetical protein
VLVLVVLLAGLVIGLWLGRLGAVNSPGATIPATTTASAIADELIVGATVAPALVNAYYATLPTKAASDAEICTSGGGLACVGVPVRILASGYWETASAPPLPGPAELWPELDVVHLTSVASSRTILAADLSPSMFNDFLVDSTSDPAGAGWTEWLNPVRQASSNGSVVFADVGSLPAARYIVYIRTVYRLPPGPYGLVETWRAVGIDVL